MRTDSRRRGGRLVLAVMAVALGLPGLAEAQQTGLFPNAPIRRQRPSCDQEDPVYKVYKQQYFGYHPTCWRRFPDGWGCPSPEAPDRAKSLKDHPFGKAPDQGEDMLGGADDLGGRPAGVQSPKPAVPPQQDPFEMDGPATPPAGGTPATPRLRQPRTAPPADTQSPFEDIPGNAAPVKPRATGPGASSGGTPNRGLSYRSQRAQSERDAELQPVADDPPLLAMPNLNEPRTVESGDTLEPIDLSATTPMSVDPNATSGAPAGAPRRSLIGSFFNNLGMNWVRR